MDYAPGASEQREEYQKMINQVRKRKIDVVLAWRYDRFARSTQALVRACWEVVLWKRKIQILGSHKANF